MSAVPVFQRILKWGGVLALTIAVVGGGIGFLVADVPGLLSALVGTAVSVLFMAVTAGSILLAIKVSANTDSVGAFFGIVMGGWLLKFVVFLIILFSLKDQAWVQPTVLFIAIVAGVIGSLAIDMVVIAKSKLTNVSDILLPTEPTDED